MASSCISAGGLTDSHNDNSNNSLGCSSDGIIPGAFFETASKVDAAFSNTGNGTSFKRRSLQMYQPI